MRNNWCDQGGLCPFETLEHGEHHGAQAALEHAEHTGKQSIENKQKLQLILRDIAQFAAPRVAEVFVMNYPRYLIWASE